MPRRLVFRILIAAALLLSVVACKDDVTGPDPIKPTMVNIWPHEDGTAWSFDGSYAKYEFPAKAMPLDTALPSMAALHAELQRPIAGTPAETLTGILTMTLDGTITTRTGVTAQNLSVDFIADTTGVTAPDPLLNLIARCRPDLRPAILRRMDATKILFGPFPPILLNGHAFAYEDSGYYGYGDLDTNHSWVYLTGGVDEGDEFSLQLIPALADNIWLHGQIWSVGARIIGGRRFANVVECMYVIDMGEQVATDENGDPIGPVRSYVYGTIFYAPEVGPVYVHQRSSVIKNDALQDAPPYFTDHVMVYTAPPGS